MRFSTSDDVEHARQIVGQHTERHLRGDLRQGLRQEVCCPHPHFDRAEWMLDCLAPCAHRVGVPIEPRLHCLDHLLVLPSRNPPLRSFGAFRFQRAGAARSRPLAVQLLAFLIRIIVLKSLASRTTIDIFIGQIDEVLLAKTAFHFAPDVIRFGNVTVMPARSQARISSPATMVRAGVRDCQISGPVLTASANWHRYSTTDASVHTSTLRHSP